MSWTEYHRASESLAAEAETALRGGNRSRSIELYSQAAEAENAAISDLDESKTRTLGITAVSAVSLHYKAGDFDSAEKVAFRWIGNVSLPSFAVDQLRNLLQSIWSEQVRERAGVRFAPGEVTVSVKGGEVVEGGAPLDLILNKVQTVQSLFYRTAELLRDHPYRMQGPPSKDIQESCRPWLFQAAPGSYQFAVAIQEPRQRDLFASDSPAPKEVAHQFLQILRAGIEDPEIGLTEIVPDVRYRRTFLKLTRNLAPRGKLFEQLEVRSSGESRSIRLDPETRKNINKAIRMSREVVEDPASSHRSVTGVLRAVHLDKDWLEVTVGDEHVKVHQVGEAVDDVIGPMVNRQVLVEVLIDPSGKHTFVDIELDD